jgi:hypothetical protein
LGCCASKLLLALLQFNEPIHLSGEGGEVRVDPRLQGLLAFIEAEWSITSDAIFRAELGLMVKLRFRLHAKYKDLQFHFLRLLKHGFLNLSAREYLGGEEAFNSWSTFPKWREDHKPPEKKIAGAKIQEQMLSSYAQVSRTADHKSITDDRWWRRSRKMVVGAPGTIPHVIVAAPSLPPGGGASLADVT